MEDGNSVLLQSHKFPGWYLAMGGGGEVADPKTIVTGSRESRFGVRAEVGRYVHKCRETWIAYTALKMLTLRRLMKPCSCRFGCSLDLLSLAEGGELPFLSTYHSISRLLHCCKLNIAL